MSQAYVSEMNGWDIAQNDFLSVICTR